MVLLKYVREEQIAEVFTNELTFLSKGFILYYKQKMKFTPFTVHFVNFRKLLPIDRISCYVHECLIHKMYTKHIYEVLICIYKHAYMHTGFYMMLGKVDCTSFSKLKAMAGLRAQQLGYIYVSFLVLMFEVGSVFSQLQAPHLICVSSSGENNKDCLSSSIGEPPCKTLDYVLNEGAPLFQNKPILVEVIYSHTVHSIKASLQGVLSMSIRGTDSVTINCSTSIILSDAENLKIDLVSITGCYGNDSYSYGIILSNSVRVQLTNDIFSSTGGVMLSNVTTLFIEACHFRNNIIINSSLALLNQTVPLLVTNMQMTTWLTISRNSFIGNWVEVTNPSKYYTAVGGMIINLPYECHPLCYITLENNNFTNNTAVNNISVGAVLLWASSNVFNASHIFIQLTNNSFVQNKVNGYTGGSGSVDFFIKGCNELTLTSTLLKMGC